MARAANGADARKRKLDEFEKRLTDMEAGFQQLESRVDQVELKVELESSYRFIRIENSKGLAALDQESQQEGFPKKELRERAGQALAREIREALERAEEEGNLQRKSDELSGNKRRWPTRAERQGTLDSLGLERLVDWVYKQQGSAWKIRLHQGEPSRVCADQIRKCINWALYVYGKLAPDTHTQIQVYPDKGPKVRNMQKGRGKGKGGGKGKGKNKGQKGGGAAP